MYMNCGVRGESTEQLFCRTWIHNLGLFHFYHQCLDERSSVYNSPQFFLSFFFFFNTNIPIKAAIVVETFIGLIDATVNNRTTFQAAVIIIYY